MRVGTITIDPVLDATFRHPPSNTYLGAPASDEEWAPHRYLLDDEWDGFADFDPVRAKAARNAMVRELEGEETPVAAAHLPGLRFGRILPGESTRRCEFVS